MQRGDFLNMKKFYENFKTILLILLHILPHIYPLVTNSCVMGRDMEVEGKGKDGGAGREIYKMVLGVEWRTPGYMVRQYMQREKLRERAERRAWRFEERLEEERGSDIVRKCLEEMKKRRRKGIAGMEGKKEKIFRGERN